MFTLKSIPLCIFVMHIFALETSTERLSLAIISGEQTFAREIDAGQRHSELAIDAIAEIFAEAQLRISDVDLIAFGQGPGSFVGVRIACGLAQGMAMGAGKKLAAVPTHMALAEQAQRALPAAVNVLVAIDARMNEIYLAAYHRDSAQPSGWRVTIAPALVKPHELPDISTIGEGAWVGLGSAFDSATLATALEDRYDHKIHTIIRTALPCATDVAAIAQRQFARGVGLLNPAEAAPLYLRNNVAQTIEERAADKSRANLISREAIIAA